MTTQEIADMLHGRDYSDNCVIPQDTQELAKANNLVIAVGLSDDLLCFYGSFLDEIGVYNNIAQILIDKKGVLPDWEDVMHDEVLAADVLERKPKARLVKAKFDMDKDYAWIIEAEFPHVCFDILEYSEKFSRGIVFSINDL